MSYPYTKVKSSNVAGVQYDDKTRELEVTFLNGSTYRYDDVPSAVGNSMPFQVSKGKAVWALLRDKYPYQKL